ncbi:efflux RND transporter periplasmic adaptor subunit [Candidatus Protochlamydia phocaeensis]|uniref:efflux RND transporter periplasmic adaptor subunit n=1 Tax=Candidatus Protochlamydia phocaeensis TaxID=1414722 RepID=UPI000838CB62|nr:efflux RND transporter periplasmic adaptor subunit [Candidatus Protochlamydia phocaeensis]
MIMNVRPRWLISFFFTYFLAASLTSLQAAEITTIGSIYPSSKSVIGSHVAGRVQAIWVNISDEVRQGQPLLKIDPIFFEIEVSLKQAALESAKIALADAEKDLTRMQNLWEKKEGQSPSISLKKLEEARSRYDQSLAAVKENEENLKRAKVNLQETLIRAPFTGVITKRLIDKGEMVTATPVTELLEIQSIEPVYLEFSIPQSCMSLVQAGTPLEFEIEGTQKKNYQAKINLLYPVLDEATRSLRCRAVIDNKNKDLLPGSLAKITIRGNQS